VRACIIHAYSYFVESRDESNTPILAEARVGDALRRCCPWLRLNTADIFMAKEAVDLETMIGAYALVICQPKTGSNN
jgi:hypothetical protein